MKRILIAAAMLVALQNAFAQVAISNPSSNPDPSAMLEIKSTNRGFLMPRLADRSAVSSPATGLMLYETATNAVWVYNGTAWVQLGSGGGGSQWITSGTHIYNANTGNVGIGINAPTAKLHLAGLMKIDGGQIDIDDNIAKIRLLYNGSPKGYFSFSSSTGDVQIGTFVGSNDVGKIQLETKSFPRLTVLPDGNVGVGSINPPEKFYVSGNIKNTGNLLTEGYLAVDGASILYGNVTGAAAATFVGNITSNNGFTVNDAAGTLQFKLNSADKGFVQLSGDDLRLGTNSSNTTGSLRVRVNGQERMNISPDGTMNLINGVDAGLSSNGYLMLGSYSGSNLVLDNNEIIARGGNGAAGNLVLQNDGGTVRIGNVAVPSGYKFAINGKMYCEELRVKLAANWPDYVFKTNYSLMPLLQLHAFIAQNNHLPNIPAASQIEKEGLQVGDMQKRMMEKIEELTLYVIDLQRQIDELKKKSNGQ